MKAWNCACPCWFCNLSLLVILLLSGVVLLPFQHLPLPFLIRCTLCCGLSVILTVFHLSQAPAHSSLSLSPPFLPLAFFPPGPSVLPVALSLSPHLPVLGPHPFLANPVHPHHPLCLPQLSGKAVVIYELWTGPAAGAGGPDYGFPEEAACLGWQGDSVYRAAPAPSTPVSRRRMECRRRPVTSFTPLRANNKTLTHSLDTGRGLHENIPSRAQGPELG